MKTPIIDIERIKIALVDDHQSFLTVVGKYLESKNFEVVFLADSGPVMFTELNTKLPDLILLDVKMPEMDGVECLIRLRKEYPKIRVIIFSQYEQIEFMLHCLGLGAHCYLPKSTETNEVIHAINEVFYKGYYYSPRIRGRINPTTTD